MTKPASLTPFRTALAIAALAAATIGGAWLFEWAGYPPCELCLKERLPYYGGVPLALVVAWLAARGRTSLLHAGFAALGLMFAAGAALAAYHTGVEWHLWPGPASCTGALDHPAAVTDFLKQLHTTTVVRCDAAALHIAGLSLAAWDVLVCVVLTCMAAIGVMLDASSTTNPQVWRAQPRTVSRAGPSDDGLKHGL